MPQAWAAGSIFRLIAILCGIHATTDRSGSRLYVDPALPDWLPELTIRNLRAGDGAAGLRFHGTEVEVLSNTTGFEIIHRVGATAGALGSRLAPPNDRQLAAVGARRPAHRRGSSRHPPATATGRLNENVEPVPELGLEPQPAAVVLDDLAADRQPEAGPARLVGQRVAGLPELLEDPGLVLRGDPDPGVASRSR